MQLEKKILEKVVKELKCPECGSGFNQEEKNILNCNKCKISYFIGINIIPILRKKRDKKDY